jgi:hypothetical protein
MVERSEVRIRADLPLSLLRQFEQNVGLFSIFRTQRAGAGSFFLTLRMADDYPAASDGVFT